MLDADCVLHDGSLARLVSTCTRTGRPVQVLYLMQAREGAGLREREGADSIMPHLQEFQDESKLLGKRHDEETDKEKKGERDKPRH